MLFAHLGSKFGFFVGVLRPLPSRVSTIRVARAAVKQPPLSRASFLQEPTEFIVTQWAGPYRLVEGFRV